MLAAVLLLQAAAAPPVFDLAALPGDEVGPALTDTVTEVICGEKGRCASTVIDPFQPDAIGICAPGSRTSYRMPASTFLAADVPPLAVGRGSPTARAAG